MVRSSDACCVLGLKSTVQAALFGLACAALGAVVASFCWASLELDVAVSPRLVHRGKPTASRKLDSPSANSHAGLVSEVKTSHACDSEDSNCPGGCPADNHFVTGPNANATAAMRCTTPANESGDRNFASAPQSWMGFLQRTAELAKHLQAQRVVPSTPNQSQAH